MRWRGFRHRGFTLVEALVSIALIGVCIGVMAALFSGAAQGMREQSSRDDRMDALSAAMQGVGLEVQQAVQGSVQPTGQPGATLTMVRVAGTASPSPTALVSVSIHWDAATATLQRICGGTTTTLARGVTAFAAAAYAPDQVEYSVTVSGADGSSVTSSEVVQPMLVSLPGVGP